MEDLKVTANGFDFKPAHAAMQRYVDNNLLSGISSAVMVGRDLVDVSCVGWADKEARTPLRPDHIFRVFSNTKLITSCAALLLMEEGKFRLDDAIEKYIPQLGNRKVLRQGATSLDDTEPARSSITIRQLLSHSSGLSYGFFDPGTVIFQALNERGVHNPMTTLAQMVDVLADLPLIYQPGTTWRYSAGADISGYVVEKLSGMRFGTFLQTRLFAPLGMKDTAFYVPREKLARLAPVYAGDSAAGRFAEVKTSPNPIALPIIPPTAPPRFDAGGAGLFSTLLDYARFAQMLGNGGALDGARILAPATVEMMGTNMISRKALEAGIPRPPVHFDSAIGFGLDAQVMLDPRAAGSLVGKNTMSWHGAFAGWWWVDPANDIVCVGMAQRSGTYPDYVFDDIDQVQKLVYQALIRPGR